MQPGEGTLQTWDRMGHIPADKVHKSDLRLDIWKMLYSKATFVGFAQGHLTEPQALQFVGASAVLPTELQQTLDCKSFFWARL